MSLTGIKKVIGVGLLGLGTLGLPSQAQSQDVKPKLKPNEEIQKILDDMGVTIGYMKREIESHKSQSVVVSLLAAITTALGAGVGYKIGRVHEAHIALRKEAQKEKE